MVVHYGDDVRPAAGNIARHVAYIRAPILVLRSAANRISYFSLTGPLGFFSTVVRCEAKGSTTRTYWRSDGRQGR
jgi:hypothetical protein